MSQEIIRIIVADDATMFLQGMELVMERERRISIIATACDGGQLVPKVLHLKPDVVVTDIQMAGMNGIDATREILKAWPACKVIGLTQFEEEDLIVDMLETGAMGYLLKTNRVDELLKAVETVHRGSPYFCDSTSLRLSKSIARSNTRHIGQMTKETFSDKELEIIRLICEQHPTKVIAKMTYLAEGTVERYRAHILEKTDSKNVVGIVIYAIRNGIFKP